MKCLLVDDEAGIREGLAMLLRRRGHEVRTACDNASAIAALGDDDFDVVITDWRLPDGLAARFVADCPHPVIAISGHPEEIGVHAAVRKVFGKPVSPSRLVDELAACVETPRVETAAAGALPKDVMAAIAAADACLPAGVAGSITDDGAFVIWTAPLAGQGVIEALAEVGGDLRVLDRRGPGGVGGQLAELRLCRDGRPDAGMTVVRPEATWPAVPEFAVDFHGAAGNRREDFASCLLRASDCVQQGRRVHFLNIPDDLASMASDWESAHRMPMREPVGPRLPAILADLWS
jgi:CheY-like chemotaxis protein